MFFFEKKNQKTFAPAGLCRAGAKASGAEYQKFFGALFFKKARYF